MAMSDTATLFAPLEDEDPATPGDPFARLRYSYGQLLGAEDFSAEQRYFVLRERLLNATLHGHGTVWGLRVTMREDAVNNSVQLVCAPGLAVDALGRLIHVGQEVCLDVTGLALAPFWADLAPPPGAEANATARRAYVVLSYRACLGDEVPAIAPPCSDSGAATAYARVLDRWRLCLQAEAPADPHPLARDGSALPAGTDLRTRLLDFILDPPAQISRLWSEGDEAPLLLATVDLEPVGTPPERTRIVAGPDNAPRALLPDVQTIAALATGTRLVGAGAAAPFALEGATAASDGTAVTVTARFTAEPHAKSVTAESLRVLRFDAATGWIEQNPVSQTITGNEVALLLGEDWTAPTTWQLLATGAGAMPLLDAAGNPLGGVAGGPQGRAPGAGQDASLVMTFEP
jgi:hypothetical protein